MCCGISKQQGGWWFYSWCPDNTLLPPLELQVSQHGIVLTCVCCLLSASLQGVADLSACRFQDLWCGKISAGFVLLTQTPTSDTTCFSCKHTPANTSFSTLWFAYFPPISLIFSLALLTICMSVPLTYVSHNRHNVQYVLTLLEHLDQMEENIFYVWQLPCKCTYFSCSQVIEQPSQMIIYSQQLDQLISTARVFSSIIISKWCNSSFMMSKDYTLCKPFQTNTDFMFAVDLLVFYLSKQTLILCLL